MDFILNELPDEHQTKETILIFKDKIDIYNKFNQISSVIPSKSPKEVFKEVLKEVPKETPKEVFKEVLKEVPKETPKEVLKSFKGNILKDLKQTPLDIIIRHTSTAIIFKNEIKEKLIEFITFPEFAKAFGVKKSAEIISALTRDSWNQSMALFISFLFDANVIYKDKSYLFNKNKNLKEIPVII